MIVSQKIRKNIATADNLVVVRRGDVCGNSVGKFIVRWVRTSPLPLRFEGDERDEHFLHGDAAVLERVLIILHVVVVVVRIGEESGAGGEDVGSGEVGLRK